MLRGVDTVRRDNGAALVRVYGRHIGLSTVKGSLHCGDQCPVSRLLNAVVGLPSCSLGHSERVNISDIAA